MNDKLKIVPFTPREPDAELIGMLEICLERAKSGEMVGCSVAGVLRDGAIFSALSTGGNPFALLGAHAYVQKRILESIESP